MKQITVGEALRIASEHHRAGRLAEAEAACRKLLAQQPDQPAALHLLGFLVAARDLDQGVALIRRAIQLKPQNAEYHNNLGCVFYAAHRYEDSIQASRRAVELKPDYAEAHYNLGTSLMDVGKPDDAVLAFRRAVAIRPAFTQAYDRLISTLRAQGRTEEAISASHEAVKACPDSVEAHSGLGMAYLDKDDADDAVTSLRKAVALSPNSCAAHVNLSIALRKKGAIDEALATALRAIELDAKSHHAHLIHGNCLRSKDDFGGAVAAYRRAIELKPDFSDGFTNLGAVLRELCRFTEAVDAFRMSIALKPDSTAARWNHSLGLLLGGDFVHGWAEYEWRWLWNGFPNSMRNFSQPRWFGSDPSGKTILVWPEQGYGDLIQFARYLPLLAQRGARVILECRPEMQRLMQRVEGISEVRLNSSTAAQFDLHTPVMSLPLGFGTRLDTIPAAIPYLTADPHWVAEWREKLGAADNGKLRIGICWAGQPRHGDDRRRSMSLAAFAPLASNERVVLYSLQKGPAAEQMKEPPPGLHIIDLGPDLKDFADTAAVIAQLDLVITVDTAVAHLAGAMGKPAWVLIASVPDWRWLLDRDDTPWYPTLRLFRQKPEQTWDPVVERVRAELNDLTDRRAAFGEPAMPVTQAGVNRGCSQGRPLGESTPSFPA